MVNWCKVKILWEGHKIWTVNTKQLFLLSSVKTSGTFFQIFVAFSKKLDFNLQNHFLKMFLLSTTEQKKYLTHKKTFLKKKFPNF